MPAVTRVRLIKTFIQEKTQDSVSSKCVEFKRTVKTSVIEVENIAARFKTCRASTGGDAKVFPRQGKQAAGPVL